MTDFKNLFSDLFELDDNMDKYQWIIDYGISASTLAVEHRNQNNLVQGCTSELWLARDQSGLVAAYSQSHIVNGVACMLCDYYNQASVQQRQDLNINILMDLGLAPLLSMGRQNGIANMLAKLKTL